MGRCRRDSWRQRRRHRFDPHPARRKRVWGETGQLNPPPLRRVNHRRRLSAAAGGTRIDLRQSARINGQEGIKSQRRRLESARRQIRRSISLSGSSGRRCSRGRARIIAYGDGRLSASSAGGPIGAAALPRSYGLQSMMMRVLAGGRGTGEEGEEGEGAGDASMDESG
jgi:hypothetical protein